MTAPDAPDPVGGPLAGLITTQLGRRSRRLVNAWVVGAAAVATAKTARSWWQGHRSYVVSVHGNDPLYDYAHFWIMDQLESPRRRSIRVTSADRRLRRGDETVTVSEAPSTRAVADPVTLHQFFDSTVSQRLEVGGHRVLVFATAPEAGFSGGGPRDEYDNYYREKARLSFTAYSEAGRDAVMRLLGSLVPQGDGLEPPRLYIATKWGGWNQSTSVRPRPASTVVLESGISEMLMSDLGEFLSSEAQYEVLGLPWHKGYLFHGPPGAGKTSIAQAMATTHDLDVYWLALGDIDDDSTLIRLVNTIQERSLLILEDVDVVHATHSREDQDDQAETQKASLSGLLNALDGMVTPHGLVTVMTTNRPDILDDALVRAGRVDLDVEIGALGADDLRRLMRLFTGSECFFPDGFEAVPADVVKIVKQHMNDLAEARRAVEAWALEKAGAPAP